MHEARVVRDVVNRVEDVAAVEHAVSVDRIRVRLGAQSHVTPESFAGHFELLAADSVVAGAELDIERSTDQNDPGAHDIRLVSVVVRA
ncbi:MAG: hydrogenase/urease maturation nickel metallochaperone HypA [Acidimicrobiia bacterium]